MEFERIQQLVGTAKVLRAGSEQQRRRREQHNPREFSELLEENLEDDEEGQASAPLPASPDVVSLSSAGKVSAETLRAAGNLARISIAQRQLLELFNPHFSEVADKPVTAEPSPNTDTNIDELA
jgi:hypothetical protein